MITLNLGVVDYPYTFAPTPTKSGRRRKKAQRGFPTALGSAHVTTGNVAIWLENKYGIMQAFYDTNQVKVGVEMARSLAGSLEDWMAGAPPNRDPFAAAATKIDAMFRDFLSSGAVERAGIPGVPTMASRRRRMGKGKRYGTRGLTSFIDTGTYENAFRAWVVI